MLVTLKPSLRSAAPTIATSLRGFFNRPTCEAYPLLPINNARRGGSCAVALPAAKMAININKPNSSRSTWDPLRRQSEAILSQTGTTTKWLADNLVVGTAHRPVWGRYGRLAARASAFLRISDQLDQIHEVGLRVRFDAKSFVEPRGVGDERIGVEAFRRNDGDEAAPAGGFLRRKAIARIVWNGDRRVRADLARFREFVRKQLHDLTIGIDVDEHQRTANRTFDREDCSIVKLDGVANVHADARPPFDGAKHVIELGK